MKRFIYILMLSAGCTFLTTGAAADDADDVKAAVGAFYEAINSGNAGDYIKFVTAEGSTFPRTGTLLRIGAGSVEEAKNNLQAGFDAGLKFDVRVHHLDAKVYGNAAVSTYYTTGPTTYPDGTVLQGTFRASIVWTKQGGQWKIVHIHVSGLQTEPK